jgi:hypothetical protein
MLRAAISIVFLIAFAACNARNVTSPALPQMQNAQSQRELPFATNPWHFVVTRKQSNPVVLPTPKGFKGTPVQLQGLLDAAKKPPAGLAGAMGVVTAKSKTSLTIQQPSLFTAPNDAPSGTHVINYTPAGSPGRPLVVSVDAKTAFASSSLSALKIGDLVMIAGAPRGSSGLSATYVIPALSGQQPMRSSAGDAGVVSAQLPKSAPVERRVVPAQTTVDDAFTFVTPPKFAVDSFYTVASAPVPLSPCASFRFLFQAVIAPLEYVSYPFKVEYNSNPPAYQATSTGYATLPAVGQYLDLLAVPNSSSGSTTVGLGIKLAIGLSGDVVSTCSKTPPTIAGKPVQMVSASFSYTVENSTSDPLPAAGEHSTLDSIRCLTLDKPLPMNLPYGLSPIRVELCDPAEIDGADVDGAISGVSGGTSSGSPLVKFDPSSGTDLLSGPTFQPQKSRMSFSLTFPDHLKNIEYKDKLTYALGLGLTLIFRTPQVDFQRALDFGDHVTARPVPVTFSGEAPLCITLTHGTPNVSGATTVCSGQPYTVTVNADLCYPEPANECEGLQSATVLLTEKNYTGTIYGAQDPSSVPPAILNNYKFPGGLCDDKSSADYSEDMLQIAPPSGAGPSSSFTITDEGPRAVSSGVSVSGVCNIVFFDSQNNWVVFFVAMSTIAPEKRR